MNWEIIGVVVEAVGALAVVASLIFVVYEVRSNTRSLARTEARETQRECTVAYYAVADNKETAEIVLRGLTGMSNLEPLDRYRFDLTVAGWLLAVEQAFYAANQNLYSEELLLPHKVMAKGLISSPGGVEWWDETKSWFSPGFQKTIEDLLRDESIKTRGETTKRDLKF